MIYVGLYMFTTVVGSISMLSWSFRQLWVMLEEGLIKIVSLSSCVV